MRWRFSGIQVHHWGSGQQRGCDRSEHGYALRNPFLRYDDPWHGCLCCRQRVVTERDSEQHDEPFVHHLSSLPSSSCSPLKAEEHTRPASRLLSLSPESREPEFAWRGTGSLRVNLGLLESRFLGLS